MNCPKCNTTNKNGSSYCNGCGISFGSYKEKQNSSNANKKRRNICVLELLSYIIFPGVGQILNRETLKGIIFFLSSIFFAIFLFKSFIVWLIFVFWAGLDAYRVSMGQSPLWPKMTSPADGEKVHQPNFKSFKLKPTYIIIIIVLIIFAYLLFKPTQKINIPPKEIEKNQVVNGDKSGNEQRESKEQEQKIANDMHTLDIIDLIGSILSERFSR